MGRPATEAQAGDRTTRPYWTCVVSTCWSLSMPSMPYEGGAHWHQGRETTMGSTGESLDTTSRSTLMEAYPCSCALAVATMLRRCQGNLPNSALANWRAGSSRLIKLPVLSARTRAPFSV